MDSATEIKNNKILLASMRTEIIEASTELTGLYKEKKDILAQIEEAKTELNNTKSASESVFIEIEQKQKALRISERDFQKVVLRIKSEIEVLEEQKKQALKELSRLNSWIFTAKEEEKLLVELLEKLKKQSEEKSNFVIDIEVFREKKETAESEYAQILLDAKLISDDAEAKQAKAEELTRKAEARLVVVKQEIKEAKETLLETNNNRLKIEKDLGIYIERVEKLYSEAFPGRTIKL